MRYVVLYSQLNTYLGPTYLDLLEYPLWRYFLHGGLLGSHLRFHYRYHFIMALSDSID
jgi:hypothetical protein